ncbi:MAG TPA: type I-U CRISPR-associated helicase/endonuclease Cas3 [Acetobacteraceae bacterium]|nr:type I-U CRISPR-associated helicase/endonuclease Cas3 [Acetobacteraceae bacterium]
MHLDDFGAVFGAIHSPPPAAADGADGDAVRPPVSPFTWQRRLLRRVVEKGWPDIIDAPTGAGKTAVLDIALFHLALAASGAQCSPAPRRIVFAVDRRVIADQAFNRACKLSDALANPMDHRVKAMAEALKATAGGDAPLHVEVLRGGMPREDEWARSPIQPTILCTTVDQLGSRLLFRGFGVSPSMAPIHAGLLGEDALLLLDEAHLSKPFQQTLNRVKHWREQRPRNELARPWAFCTLTATPRRAEGCVFRLSDAEKAEEPVKRRLTAAKTAGLEPCKEPAGSSGHVEAFVAAAQQLMRQCASAAPSVAIIVNRVALARSVLKALQNLWPPLQDEAQTDCAILLTGRVRPVERESLLHDHERRLTSQGGDTETQAAAEPPTGRLFVVATQCIEAGADFDFDAMVTQIAPLDALRQRFGRLNRLGLRDHGPAIIIAARDEIARGNDDALYRGTLKETWDWLSAHAAAAPARGRPSIEINPQAFETLVNADLVAASRCVVEAKDAPVLRAADVALLGMTNPRPQPDPYLPLFLHGELTIDTDVSIVWRADCEIIASLPEGLSRTTIAETAAGIVACQPPVPGEALRVPVWAARTWLIESSDGAADVSDAETERDPSHDWTTGGRWALRWRGPDDKEPELVRAAELRPGDVIIVPSSYGGCDRFGWAPGSEAPVVDIADAAAKRYASRRFSLRLHPALWKGPDCIAWKDAWPQLQEAAAADNANGLITALREMMENQEAVPRHVHRAVEALVQSHDTSPARKRRVELPYDANQDGQLPSGAVLIAPYGIGARDRRRKPASPSTEDDQAGCFADGSVSLARHTSDVVKQADAFAAGLRLVDRLKKTIAFAAQQHDAGKADDRFQDWLRGPDTPRGELLAKSGRSRGRAAEQAARAAAGVPAEWRHEALSVRIARQHLGAAGADIDPALALYLIGTHHGHGRPFFRHRDPWDAHARRLAGVTLAAGPGPERLDFEWEGRDWAELFAGLQAEYGPWGLAFLEAVLRLADHRASESEA